MRIDLSYMVVISHFKLYPALFPLKWLICIPNISAVRGNVVFDTLHDFYRTVIKPNRTASLTLSGIPKDVETSVSTVVVLYSPMRYFDSHVSIGGRVIMMCLSDYE